ncbi:MAG: CehA/McbA family metallohydrolase, partial [Gemmatimonadetes bacterium]|nr:CehA/McbA family metallohydrolase [Gemmatimonadota bacterium]
RYPRVAGYSHHVYLEGYELPILTNGPMDPAPSPDGRTVALSHRGWLWLLDLGTGEARRITSSGGMDSRPAWSPDGRQLAFLRDDTRNISIVLLDLASGRERVLVAEPALDLDPAFSPDGRVLYYSSGAAGDLDLWGIELASGQKTRITEQRGIELRPLPHPDGRRLVYLSKTGGVDEVRVRDLLEGSERVLLTGRILSQLRPALSPDGRTLAFNWPGEDHWELRLVDVEVPGSSIRLTRYLGQPLAPQWSADGATIYFSEADREQRMVLKRIAAVGGEVEEVAVRRWNWGAPTGRVRVRTRLAGRSEPVPARLHIRDAGGHPAIPDSGQSRFDGQNGLVYFFSPGEIELELPAGEVEVSAVHGLTTPVRSVRQRLRAGETRTLEIELSPVWDPRSAGWYAGDHHFHLNYGGQYRLEPEDLLPILRGEGMDVATPLVANLHDRFGEQGFWGWKTEGEPPLIEFGQEVRSHFLGHVMLMGIEQLFWPWIWGPGYQVYGADDRTNAQALQHARRQNGMGIYVHPVSRPDPFAQETPPIPLELIPDAVLGDMDGIELVCLWSDELGTAEVWYRILNLGIPVVPTAGTDAMTDFFRTMALGTTRVYVRPEGEFNHQNYLAGLKAGRSFATNGPLLDFRLAGSEPGAVVQPGQAPWTLELYSAVPVERVEILVNGQVAWSGEGLRQPGRKSLTGTLTLPAGGWVAARAVGGETTRWPAMDSYAFGHTSPLWIGRIGSTDPTAERAAAGDLLRALQIAEQRLIAGYGGAEIPNLRARFQQARQELERRAGS